ncbi:eukaryotic rRNA processing protein EBP2-domain-containing protein [Dipodascopsis tothii]|uniref:eukaryotic rRNA processing protein EBP2-domain-containing protein n=1 Tax=Dipodascopsis tothii TaxID=44089 RepID=UPI0034CEA4D2
MVSKLKTALRVKKGAQLPAEKKRLQDKIKSQKYKKKLQAKAKGDEPAADEPEAAETAAAEAGPKLTRKEAKKLKQIEAKLAARAAADAADEAESSAAEEDDEDEDEDEDVPDLVDTALAEIQDDVSSDEEDGPVFEAKIAKKPRLDEAAEAEDDGVDLEELLTGSEDDDEDDEAEDEDLIPYQKLTINNTKALEAALRRIALPHGKMAFVDHMSVTAAAPVAVDDVHNDLGRELGFYNQALDAAYKGRAALAKAKVPFSRPEDYFAEMLKTDAHMERLRNKMLEEAGHKKAAEEARRQRDLKKFGKQVQVSQLQKRAKEKRATLEKVKDLKRKRGSGTDISAAIDEL